MDGNIRQGTGEHATPEPIPYEELDINMGERWIDPQLYADFAAELFGVEAEVMYFDVNDTYVVRLKGYSPGSIQTPIPCAISTVKTCLFMPCMTQCRR